MLISLFFIDTVTFHAANEDLNHCHLKGQTALLMFIAANNSLIQRCTRRDLIQNRIVLYTLALKRMENKMSVSVLILQAVLLPRRHSCVAGATMQNQHYALCFLNSLHKVGQPTLLQRDEQILRNKKPGLSRWCDNDLCIIEMENTQHLVNWGSHSSELMFINKLHFNHIHEFVTTVLRCWNIPLDCFSIMTRQCDIIDPCGQCSSRFSMLNTAIT